MFCLFLMLISMPKGPARFSCWQTRSLLIILCSFGLVDCTRQILSYQKDQKFSLLTAWYSV